jgi:phosphoribosylamine-glycine ligase
MVTEEGPKVLEYNCRFGDPETQVLMPLLNASYDLVDILLACIEGRLDALELQLQATQYAATVVLASSGYPNTYEKYKPITYAPGAFDHGKKTHTMMEGGREGISHTILSLQCCFLLQYRLSSFSCRNSS